MDNKKEEILIISLQGIGNSIINLRLIKKILSNKQSNLSIIISNNGSEQLYKEVFKKNRVRYITWFEQKSSFFNFIFIIAKNLKKRFNKVYALYPCAKRENIIIKFIRSDYKLMYRAKSGKNLFQFLNNRMPIIKDSNQHDFYTNKKLLGIKESINLKENKMIAQSLIKYNVGFHVGGGDEFKRWGSEKFIRLINKLSKKMKINISIFGGPAEVELSNKVINSINVRVERVINETFEVLIKKMSNMDLFIGNDSSLAHLSSFLKIPTIVIWSFAEHNRFYPNGMNNIVIRKDFKCMPCYTINTTFNEIVSNCTYSFRCIKDISMDDVFEVIMKRESLDNIKNLSKITVKPDGCKIVSIN